MNYARKAIKIGVEDYEKKGTKLYSISILPFLLYFLREDASACHISAEACKVCGFCGSRLRWCCCFWYRHCFLI